MIQRTMKEVLLDTVQNYPITLVTGARQIGKSTLCYELVREFHYSYVSLDDIDERAQAISDPKFFLSRYKTPLIIDEVQYAPILFEVIESIVNQTRLKDGDANGMFILTGSQNFQLMKHASQSMAGRVGILQMEPLSQSEVLGRCEIPFQVDITQSINRTCKQSTEEFFSKITRGFYPELYRNPNIETNTFYSNYISTYIDKDVSELIQIKNKLDFHKLMQLLASLTGEELIYDNLAKQIGVDKKTIMQWISILEASNIIYLLQPYYEFSLSKRVVKRPKIYFKDTGLCCHLAKLGNPKNLEISHFSGHFVETYAMNEIIKSYKNTNTNAEFYYYRDNEQNKIDCIILHDGILHLVEIRAGMSFDASTIKAFEKLKNSKYRIGDSCVLCLTDNFYKIKDNVYALSITSI